MTKKGLLLKDESTTSSSFNQGGEVEALLERRQWMLDLVYYIVWCKEYTKIIY
jgi:hypothetical protein